jgi:hypothetical protein
MKYQFVPISQRRPLRWPNGKRLALMITTNLEYWDATKDTPKPFYPGGPGIVGGDLPGNVYDNPNYTWREYGQRVGVWRMFDVFDKFGVPSTCTMNAKMGLERRAVVDAALKRGWEIVAHNYVQTELLVDYSVRREQRTRGDPRNSTGIQGGLRQAGQRLALQLAPLHAQYGGHSGRGGTDLHHRPAQRRPTLSGRDALRQENRLDPLHVGGQ